MESFISLKKRKWLLPLVFCVLISCFLVIFSVFTTTNNPFHLRRSNVKDQVPIFVESKLLHVLASTQNHHHSGGTKRLPRLAYLISGSSGDGKSLRRTLMAIYHPLNQYVLHLDLEAPIEERLELAHFIKNYPLFAQVGNVRVVSRSNLVTYRGPSMVTNTLHAAAILMKEGGDWDWFINLSASDYPLLTQDGISAQPYFKIFMTFFLNPVVLFWEMTKSVPIIDYISIFIFNEQLEGSILDDDIFGYIPFVGNFLSFTG